MGDYLLGLYEKAMPATVGWAERLRTAKLSGYDFLEMSIDETDEKLARLDMDALGRRTLRELAQEEGVPIGSICLSGHRRFPLGSADPQNIRKSLSIIEKAITLAGDLGVRVIQIAGYDVYYEPSTPDTKARFAENLKKSVEWAAKAGVVLAFETMETPFLNTVEKCMKYVTQVSSPWLQIYPDTGNIANALGFDQAQMASDLAAGRGHLAAIHLKEALPGKFREIPYGQGNVDFQAVVQAGYDAGVRRFVAEFWYQEGDNWREQLKQNAAFIRQFFMNLEREETAV